MLSIKVELNNLVAFISVGAGASTVSLDLDKKWLDRIRPQMEANGITEWEGKHDCIYGDVSVPILVVCEWHFSSLFRPFAHISID